jgi:hypothetical protein
MVMMGLLLWLLENNVKGIFLHSRIKLEGLRGGFSFLLKAESNVLIPNLINAVAIAHAVEEDFPIRALKAVSGDPDLRLSVKKLSIAVKHGTKLSEGTEGTLDHDGAPVLS